MATDTLTLNTGSGGDDLSVNTLAGGEKVQNVKILSAEDASETQIYAGSGGQANALRVVLANDVTDSAVKLVAGSATVGTVNLGTFPSAATTSPFKLEDSASASGDMLGCYAVRQATPADSSGADGDYEPLKLDNGRLWVQGGGSQAHDAAYAAATNLPTIVSGVAMEMDGTTLDPVAVAAGDVTYFRADRDGRQLVNQCHPASGNVLGESSSAQTALELVAQPAAGFSIYITDIQMSAITAQTAWLHDEDDGVVFPLQYFGANTGNVSISFVTPLKLTAAKALEITTTAAVAHSWLVNYYIAP